jgi:adenosylmethionine-8-amino-7-oxononanoate aminotransferase
MSVCDPERGMHHLFAGALAQQVFAPAPESRYGSPLLEGDTRELERIIEAQRSELCALILEPIVQNAGGMRFYSAEYLAEARRLCDEHDLLLIADEIATGFGRTGKLFACEHAGVTPDILCLGKALTGGTLSLAAALTQPAIAATISQAAPGRFMHGPTFMGNPLGCAVALSVLDVLSTFDWKRRVLDIGSQLERELEPCRSHPGVADVRVLGAIGVVEMQDAIDVNAAVPMLVDRGVWLRPFGNLLYTMPPFIISEQELRQVTSAMCEVVSASRR